MLPGAAELHRERQRRWLYGLFGLAMSLSLAICTLIGFQVLNPPPGRRLVGTVDDFVPGRVTEVAVPRLEITQLLPGAPAWSDNIVFVLRHPDDAYTAFLGFDPVSGCKLNWRSASQTFYDLCTNVHYNLAGSNQSQPASLSATPARLIELPVQIEGQQVYILDRIRYRDRR